MTTALAMGQLLLSANQEVLAASGLLDSQDLDRMAMPADLAPTLTLATAKAAGRIEVRCYSSGFHGSSALTFHATTEMYATGLIKRLMK